jgi:hypothetical protein
MPAFAGMTVGISDTYLRGPVLSYIPNKWSTLPISTSAGRACQMREPEFHCIQCRHFRITWNPSFPYACKAWGIRSAHHPAMAVRASSGLPCQLREAKIKGDGMKELKK